MSTVKTALLSAAAATGNGTAVDIGFRYVNAIQVVITGAPSAVALTIRGSLDDGTTFDTIAAFNTATGLVSGDIIIPTQVPLQWVIANLGTLTGGTAPTVTVYALCGDDPATGFPAGGTGSGVDLGPVSAATLSAVASAATSAQLLAANAARKGVLLCNTDANAVLLKYGTTASATSFTVRVPGGNGQWEMQQPIYTGRIDAIWEADGTGSAYVTEL